MVDCGAVFVAVSLSIAVPITMHPRRRFLATLIALAISPRSRPAFAKPTKPASARVPILMYHYVSDPPADADRVRRDLTVSAGAFEAQLRYLRGAGHTTISRISCTLT